MPSLPTRSAGNSLAKDSRLIVGNHAAAKVVVVSVTSTTIVIDSAAELTGTALYTPAKPGMVEVISCVAGTANQGKTANITGISTTTLTVNADFTAFLAAGDIIFVSPPLSTELYMHGGHTLDETNAADMTMALNQTFDTDNTPMAVDVAGDVPIFLIPTSEGLTRLLAHGFGTYKTPTAGTHKYRPGQANDGTFATSKDATMYSQEGNGVIRRIFYGLFSTKIVLDVPQNSLGVGTLSELGVSAVREIGGTGKTFPSGTQNRTVTDGVTNTDTSLTSATAAFTALDVGAGVSGTGIASGTTISSVTNGTTVVLSQATTATATGVTVIISRQNYIRTNFVCDTGPRLSFRGAFVQLGGAFGDALSSPDPTVLSINVTIERGAIQDRPLGSPSIIKPEEDTFKITVTGTRMLQTNQYHQDAFGQSTDAEPGFKTETRMLVKFISLADAAKTLTIDMARGIFTAEKPRRQRGRFHEDFTFTALATYDANGCPSTSTPPIECTLVSGVAKDILAAI